MPRLGDILVDQGAISRAMLEQHLLTARGKLGNYLRAHNLLSGRALAQGLATQQQLPFVSFSEFPPDARLFVPRELSHYTAHHYVPYARGRDGMIVATSEPSTELAALLASYYQTPVRLVTTGARDISQYFASTAATTTTRRARLSLRRKYPHLTADRTLLPHQQWGLLLLAALLASALWLAPFSSWETLLLLCNVFYLFSLYMKVQLFRQGHQQLRLQRRQAFEFDQQLAALDPAMLPIYTILIPLYKESAPVIARLITSLSALDYPAEKLDIKLICEADDRATLAALKRLAPPQMMEILRVPPSLPRTKPKACNVAFQQIRGEYLVIYDAEDAPAPDQLKRAVALFRHVGPRVACLQARLNYYNRRENLLTRLFAIEYSALFRLNLPALERMNLPIPLGGTSNHLRVAALTEAGGWDAFNVTEDADLGMRLAYLGYYTRVLASLTLEEAPISLRAWMQQRTRWIKGYIQTWLVFMRDPVELKKRLGPSGYYGFQFFIGAPALTFLMAPFFWIAFFAGLAGYLPSQLSLLTQTLCILSFLSGIASNWSYARAVIHIEQWQGMRAAMLIYPLYWMLHSIAAARAIWQLAFRPHYWGKTRHGVSKFVPKAALRTRTA